MKRQVDWVLLILFFIFLPAMTQAQDIKVGTFFDHSGSLKDWGPRHQNAADLATKQMAETASVMYVNNPYGQGPPVPKMLTGYNFFIAHFSYFKYISAT